MVISMYLCTLGRLNKFPKAFLFVPHNFWIETEDEEWIEGGRDIIK